MQLRRLLLVAAAAATVLYFTVSLGSCDHEQHSMAQLSQLGSMQGQQQQQQQHLQRNSHRRFCVPPPLSDTPPAALQSSDFNDLAAPFRAVIRAQPSSHGGAAHWRGVVNSSRLTASLLQQYELQQPCAWAPYRMGNTWKRLCTHDPNADMLISRHVHSSGAWFDDEMHASIAARLPNGTCSPHRPVVLDIGLNIGTWTMLALERGCQVVAFDALSMNVQRVVQSTLAAVDGDGRPYIERLHAYHNAVGKVRGTNMTVKVRRHNIGGSRVQPGNRPGSGGTEPVRGISLEDLFFTLPDAERPQVRVASVNAATGLLESAWVPLQPRHVALIKVDVEGFDLAALYTLRRLFEGPVDDRPLAFITEFSPMGTTRVAECAPLEFVRFMYEAGYVYADAPDDTVDSVLSMVWEMLRPTRYTQQGSPPAPSLEDWWDLSADGHDPRHITAKHAYAPLPSPAPSQKPVLVVRDGHIDLAANFRKRSRESPVRPPPDHD